MSRTIPQIIDDLGGITALSKKLGHRFPSKVQGWKEREKIPLHHVDAVVSVSREIGKPVTKQELIDAAIAASIATAARVATAKDAAA